LGEGTEWVRNERVKKKKDGGNLQKAWAGGNRNKRAGDGSVSAKDESPRPATPYLKKMDSVGLDFEKISSRKEGQRQRLGGPLEKKVL